ncbi:MAG: DUF4397 domain-containing protein [Bdellovibrionales bacterium]|nr:DUF4397 domain-containing protein [Bdellovibrionales bacterium]
MHRLKFGIKEDKGFVRQCSFRSSFRQCSLQKSSLQKAPQFFEVALSLCMKKLPMCSALLLLLLLPGCGGGGGGGDSSEASSRFGVRVIHGVLEATPLEYSYSSAPESLFKVKFLDEGGYRKVAEGGQVVNFSTANSGGTDHITNRSFTVEPEARYTVFLFGDQSELGLRSAFLSDFLGEIPPNVGMVRVLHSVDSANGISAKLGSASTVHVSFGGASSYFEVPAGPVSYSATRESDGAPLASGAFEIEAGRAYTLLIAGEVGVFVRGVLYSDS